MSIKTNIENIRDAIIHAAEKAGRNPDGVTLVAVSKRKPAEKIEQAIESGQKDFGENYIQEAMEKIDILGRDAATWHFIGHLQSNKAKFAVKYFDLIHTVDSVKLAAEINKQAAKINKIQPILLQVNIALETTKSGAAAVEVQDMVRQMDALENIRLEGLMCMPPFFDDPEEARIYFKKLNEISRGIRELGLGNTNMTHLSMGMSNDFGVAVEEGATLVRVGTAIFGERQ